MPGSAHEYMKTSPASPAPESRPAILPTLLPITALIAVFAAYLGATAHPKDGVIFFDLRYDPDRAHLLVLFAFTASIVGLCYAISQQNKRNAIISMISLLLAIFLFMVPFLAQGTFIRN